MAKDFFEFQDELNARKAAARRPASRPIAGDTAVPAALTVGQLTAQIERVLKGGFPVPVLVKGEVSNLKLHSGSGHVYFTLKDPDACINCVMFRSDAVRLKFEPADGMELLASGRVAVYAQRGSYQLYVTRLDPLGQGALELAFRQLCEKLEKEGLFAKERKKPVSAFPMRLVLVTSRATAALQDMLKVLRRFPWVRLMLYHVPVQGDGAAELIAQSLRDICHGAASLGGVDGILLGRGGGSLEDLWAFNEEVVARAVCSSTIPIITGIGHEIDVSIADLVADYHAHTPTEAAQVAMGRWRTVAEDVDTLGVRIRAALRSAVQQSRSRLANIERHEFFRKPGDRVGQLRQRVDDLQQDLESTLNGRLNRWRQQVDAISLRLAQCSPRHLLARKQQQLSAMEMRLLQHHPQQRVNLHVQQMAAMESRLQLGLRNAVDRTRVTVDSLERHLHAIGPQQVLARGYSITTLKKGGVIVRSKTQIRHGQRLVTRLADGEVESVAEDPNQPTLFE